MPSGIAEIMRRLPVAFALDGSAGSDAIVHFKLTGEQAGEWNAVIQDGKCKVAQGLPRSRPTITMAADTRDLVDIVNGSMDAMSAFMAGKIKITGDRALALKLMELIASR